MAADTAYWDERPCVALREVPGAHVPYMDRPREFVDALRPLLHDIG